MSLSHTRLEKNARASSEQALFSILIPSWNNLAYLKLCIDSIKKNSTHQHQIIVHINEGKDGTLDWLKAQADIDYTFSDENIGICYALNYAATIATTDYIVFMNDDMYVLPQWDEMLWNEVKQVGHKLFFISSTMIEPYDTNNPCVIHKSYGTDIAAFNEAALLSEYASLQKEDWCGATWPPNIVHKDVWDLVGGYSTEFHPGMYSDPDFSMKLWRLGVRLFKGSSKSRVYHFSGRSTGRVKKNKGYYTFIQKWGCTPGFFVKKYLKRGEPFTGYLSTPDGMEKEISIKNLFKRFIAATKQ